MSLTYQAITTHGFIPYTANANIKYPGHQAGISKTFLNCLERGNNLDLVFICNRNTRVGAHKIVLSTVSEFLKSLILSNQDDVIYISLPNVEYRHAKILIDFIYEGICRLNFDDLVALKDLVSVLCINLPNSEIITVDTVHNPLFNCGRINGDIISIQNGTSEVSIRSCEVSYDKPDARCSQENKVQKALVRPFPSRRLAIMSSNVEQQDAEISGTDEDNMVLSVNKETCEDPVFDTAVETKEELIIDEVIILDSDDEECIPDSSVDVGLQTKCNDENQIIKEPGYSHNIQIQDNILSQVDSRLAILEDFYEKNRFINGKTLKKLSDDIGLSRRFVYRWFLRKQKEGKTRNRFLRKHLHKKENFSSGNDMYKEKCVRSSDGKRMPLTLIVEKIQDSRYRVKQGVMKNINPITRSQFEILEDVYNIIKFPDKETKTDLSLKTGLPFETVKRWFCKRRYEDKKNGIPVFRNFAFKGFSCEVCSKNFATKTILRKHFEEHSYKKPYKCEICDVELPNKQLLRYHLDIHKISLETSLDF